MRAATVLDAAIPGSGLLLDGRLAAALPVLVPAVLVLALLTVALALGGAIGAWVWPRAVPAHLVLAAAALLLRWHFARRARIDPARARELARAAARAWLRGEDAAAAQAARELVRAAPEVPNAWRMLALVAGDPRAERRAQAIEGR